MEVPGGRDPAITARRSPAAASHGGRRSPLQSASFKPVSSLSAGLQKSLYDLIAEWELFLDSYPPTTAGGPYMPDERSKACLLA